MENPLKQGFDGAALKVERAYRHIDELKSIVEGLSGGPSDAFTTTKKPDGTEVVTFSSLGPAGRFIPLVIGDAIHNLRAAFDHLRGALARAAEPDRAHFSKVNFAKFPFDKERKNVKSAVEKGPVKEAFPETERLILDEIKPYSDAGGDMVLWSITKFDKLDKHNLVIPTINVHHFQSFVAKLPGGLTIKMTDCAVNLGGSFIEGPAVEYQGDGKITLDITFPEGDLLGRQPVLPMLLNMARSTSKAVKLFRETFL